MINLDLRFKSHPQRELDRDGKPDINVKIFFPQRQVWNGRRSDIFRFIRFSHETTVGGILQGSIASHSTIYVDTGSHSSLRCIVRKVPKSYADTKADSHAASSVASQSSPIFKISSGSVLSWGMTRFDPIQQQEHRNHHLLLTRYLHRLQPGSLLNKRMQGRGAKWQRLGFLQCWKVIVSSSSPSTHHCRLSV